MSQYVANRDGWDSNEVLIAECRNDACRKAGAVDDQHNFYGRREWPLHVQHREPVGGEDALRCPNCGERGVMYDY